MANVCFFRVFVFSIFMVHLLLIVCGPRSSSTAQGSYVIPVYNKIKGLLQTQTGHPFFCSFLD